jgi:hypothetical protein
VHRLFRWENLREKENLEDIDGDGRRITHLICNECDGNVK